MADRQSEGPDDVIGLDEASALLEVTRDRVQVLIDGGILNPVGRPGEPRFYRGEVIAARELGG
ncbi:MAG TPA: hypothetical protein VG476_01370 [Acidimicrobiales bacterium]|nr:hypothetical protein [Acidimicrobiales bacterium]